MVCLGAKRYSVEVKRICVDMDEVIADALGEHLMRYNREHGEQISKADMDGKWIWDVVSSDRHESLARIMQAEDFFASLPVMEGSQRVLRRLQKSYEVFIATAAMEVPTSFLGKYAWLAEHFPFIPASHLVYCGSKSILRADYLIDDNPRQLRLFEGEGILFDAPHNAYARGFRRVCGWDEVEALFLGTRLHQA